MLGLDKGVILLSGVSLGLTRGPQAAKGALSAPDP